MPSVAYGLWAKKRKRREATWSSIGCPEVGMQIFEAGQGTSKARSQSLGHKIRPVRLEMDSLDP